MLDTLIIHVPIKREFVRQVGNLYSVMGDVADYQILAVPSYLKRDFDGKITYGELKHPFEKVPSSFASMAIKFYATNVANTHPYIALNASCKILQGHNAYGGESIYNMVCEMLTLLQGYYPAFFACLDIPNATVSRLDSTYSVELAHERLVQPCIRFIGKISHGHRRNDTDRRDFYNTVYFGGKTSRLGGAKVYGKHHQLQDEFNDLSKKAKRGCTESAKKLDIFTDELMSYSSRLLRFESSTKRRHLERQGIPTNLWQLVDYQHQHPNMLCDLWRHWFNPILEAMKGEVMNHTDDNEIYDLCMTKLVSTTNSGKVTYTRAKNAYKFYKLIKQMGYVEVKGLYSSSQFNNLVKSLVDIGIPKAVLQNLQSDKGMVIPMVELLNLNFDKQAPDGYVPPFSEHFGKYDDLLTIKRPILNRVA